MHHPMRSAGQHGSSLHVRAALAPLFRTYGVQLVHLWTSLSLIDGGRVVI